MRIDRVLLFVIACRAATLTAQEPTDISVEIEGMLKDSPVPSLAAAAVLDGKIVSQGAAGLRKHDNKTKVTVDDKYHIGSCTKSMTAVLGALLVESGKLKWETTVSEVFKDLDIDQDYENVTLRQLLTNTAGVPGDVGTKLWSTLWRGTGSLPDQRMKLVEGILERPAAYEPGTREVYSNAGFSIAGAMMETITGKSYEELLKEMLFEPLSMDSAGFRAPATNGKIDQPYGHSVKRNKIVPVEPEPRGDNPAALAPAGAVHCSIADFAKYARFHLGGGEEKALSEETMRTLHTPLEGNEYAMGWIVTKRTWAGGRALTHAGSNTMFYAVIWVAPERGFAAVAMCNYGGEEGFQKCDEAIGHLIKKHL